MKFFLLAAAALALPFAAQAKNFESTRYTCTAFNPFTGPGMLAYDEAATGKNEVELRYGYYRSLYQGGKISFSDEAGKNYPKASMQNPALVNLIFFPVKFTDDNKANLIGISYLPFGSNGMVPYQNIPAPYGALQPFTGGGVPTATLYCQAEFKEVQPE